MSLRGFLKFLSVIMAAGLSLLLTMIWVNAYVFGGSTTVYINEVGEAAPELALFFGFVWPVISVGLYFLAVDEEWIGRGAPEGCVEDEVA